MNSGPKGLPRIIGSEGSKLIIVREIGKLFPGGVPPTNLQSVWHEKEIKHFLLGEEGCCSFLIAAEQERTFGITQPRYLTRK